MKSSFINLLAKSLRSNLVMKNGLNELPNSQSSSDPSGPTEGDDDNYGINEIFSVSWNQDCQCFTVGTNSGFRIYNCEPLNGTFQRDLTSDGLTIVEMLFRTNILALVGSSTNKEYPPNKLIIWDDHSSRCLTEFAFRTHVKAVKLRHDIIVVVLEHKIYMHSFKGLKLLHHIDTLHNSKGVCSISYDPNTFVLACPGMQRGQVRVYHFGLKVTKFVRAHDSDISCLALTTDGLILATSSVKGTLIRIFNTLDGILLQEVRRGTERAEIYSIAISPCVQWLAVSSDKGTIHVFRLKVRVYKDEPNENYSDVSLLTSADVSVSPNKGCYSSSSFSFMKGVLPKYFSSEWSFARCHLPKGSCYIAAFGAPSTIMVLGMDGSFTKCCFDPEKGGEMVQLERKYFLKT